MAGEPVVTIDGNVARDPKLNTTRTSGRRVTTLRVLQTPWRKRDGGNQEAPTPIAFDLVCWDDLAEHAVESLATGTAVTAHGRIRGVDVYEAGGETRATIVVDVDSIGPSLKFATAQVARRAHAPAGSAPAGDGWPTQEAGSSWAPSTDSSPWGAR